jgi:hypothetical protein
VSTANITPQQILDAIELVPAARWGEVLQTIESFQTKPPSDAKTNAPVVNGTDLRGSELIGIWADRTEIQNAQEFARGLR